MKIIKIPLINANGKTIGCERAPEEIINSLKEIGSSENNKIINFKELNIEEIRFDRNNLEEAGKIIFKKSKEVFQKEKKVIFLGGDHSISYPIVKALEEVVENPLLIIFDAHADCVKSNEEVINHEQWLYKIIEEGFSPENVVLISARDFWPQEIEFLKKNKILLIDMDILQEDLEGVCDMIMERARNSGGFYISLDIDCLDPGFSPGTGYLEPGGLSSRELIYMIKRLRLLNNFIGGDIVEINPLKDVNGMTVKLGAKIIAEMM